MDKDIIVTMPPAKRVQEINKMLKEHSLAEIYELLEIPSG